MPINLLISSRHVVRSCPVCGCPLHIGVHLFGQNVTCGHCRGRFTASDSDDLSGGLAARVDRLVGAHTRFASRTVRPIRSGPLSGKWIAGDGPGLSRVPTVRPRRCSEPETARAAVCAFPGKLKRVLLVEHRDEVFDRLAVDLVSIQFHVTRAFTASAASRRFAACPSDLMIAHVDLPDESGWLLAAKLRLVFPTARIWLYTAHPSALDRNRARYLGVARLMHYGGDLLRLGGKVLNRLT